MPQPTDDFAELLAEARQGKPQALELLSQRYEAKVRVVARVLLGPALQPHLDSLDLVQSVHKSLLLGLRNDKFDISSPDKLVALALTIVRRKVARKWRHLRRQVRNDPGAASEDCVQDRLASLTCPEDADPVRVAQLNEQITKLFATLDATDQQIMRLRLDGYSTDEMAERLSLNPVTLRVRLTRLRQRLITAGLLDEWL
jgi:RNA polymerase sigma-70 factor (ECF subfamily)